MAEESNGGLVFGIRLDNSQLAKDVETAQRLFESLSKRAGESGTIDINSAFSGSGKAAQQAGHQYNKALSDLYIAAGNAGSKIREESTRTATSVSDDLNKLNGGFNAITGLAGKMFLGVSAMEIGHKMFETRSYFQDAESSMKVFLGDAEEGKKFFSELKDYAFYNMFSFQELVGASKQLISYGSTTKEIIGDIENGEAGILDKLSNIATGIGASLNDMIGMYNKAKSVGKVDSQGLESWAARGVLVKETLKEMGEVVGSTGVTFQQLNKVLDKVTGEGGMFHNLMSEQLNNLSASAAQLGDNLTAMWAEMGEKAEPYMKAAIDLAGVLVENYQGIADVLLDVAKVYGAYKLVDMSGLQGIIEQTQAEQNLVETFKEHSEEIQKMFSADQAYQMELSGLKEGTAEYAQAVKDMFDSEKQSTSSQLENITKLENAENKRIETLVRERQEIRQKIFAAEQSNDVLQKEALTTKAATIQEQLNASQNNLSAIQKQKNAIASNAKTAATKAEALATMQSTTATKAATTASVLWNKATTALGTGIKKLGATLKATLLSNPYALAIAGAVALADAIYQIITAESAREQAQKSIDEGLAKGFANAKKELEKTAIPDFANLEKLEEGTKEYQKAVDNLVKKYPELKWVMDDNTTKAELLSKGYDTVRDAIIRKNKAAEASNAIDANNAKLTDKQEEILTEFREQLEEQGFSQEKAYKLAADFEKSLIDGVSFDKLSDEIKQVFANDTTIFGNFTTADGFFASIKEAWTDPAYKHFNSHLEAMFARIMKLKEANEKAAESVKDLTQALEDQKAKAQGQKDSEDEWLKVLGRELEEVTGKINSYSLQGIIAEGLTGKKALKELQAERNRIQKEIEQTKKYLTGDDYNAQKAKYKRQIELHKQFAQQYTQIEIKRQNEIKKLNESRDKKGANQGVIDLQIEELNKKSDDDLKLLFAKFYNVSESTAEKIKSTFSDALALPVEQAKTRLAEVTELIEKIKAVSQNGDTIATKEQQAALEAERAGLQQNIDLVREENSKRIEALQRLGVIEKEQAEKLLSDEGRKQIAIKETYDAIRKELKTMLDAGRITEEQYDNVMWNVNNNEFHESEDAFISAYGDFAQKREKLVREWDAKLADIPEEYLKVAEKEMKEDLAAMDFEKFKKDLNWEVIFEDLSSMTSKQLVQSLDRLQSAFEEAKDSMTFEQILEYKKAVQSLNNELAARNPWKTIVTSIKSIKTGKDNAAKAIEAEEKALTRLNKANAERNELLKQKADFEKLLAGNPDDEFGRDLQTWLSENAEKLEKAETEVAEATDDYTQKAKEAKQANDELEDSEGNLANSFINVAKTISSAGNAFSQLGDAMGESGETMKELGDTLSSIGSTVESTMSAIKSGSKSDLVSSAISNTVNMVSVIVKSRKKYNEEQKNWKIAQQRFADNLNVTAIQKVREKNKDKNIWYTDYNAQADDAAKAYQMAQDKLLAQIDKLDKEGKAKRGQRGGVDWGAVGQSTASGAAAGAAIGTIIGGWAMGLGTVIGTAVGGVVGFIGGLFGSKKKKDIWGGLLTEFPELVEMGVDGEERINTALAEQLIEQGMLNDETKEMVETAMKYQEEMDAAKQEITDIVSQLTGEMGNNIMDALVDAFKAGTDGAEAFGDSVDKVLENMIKKLIFNAAFSQYFDKLQKQYEKIFLSGASQADKVTMLMQATKEFKDEASTGVETMNEFMRQARDYGDTLGMNLFKGDSEQQRNSVSGGIANVTQDTAEEMNGRLTQIQSHTFSINASVKQMTEFSSQQLIVLRNINTDTSELVKTVSEMKATVDDIQIKGVKLK